MNFMHADSNTTYSSHLSDFETTTSCYLRNHEAITLLNFAALFHEHIYLTDTVIGDNNLIISSHIHDGSRGLFGHVMQLIRNGILKILIRDKVVYRGKVLYSEPTISDIFTGWCYRDEKDGNKGTGYTTIVESGLRERYNKDVDKLLLTSGSSFERYDPDVPKSIFRKKIRSIVNSSSSSNLLSCIEKLPKNLRDKYLEVIKDDWFTNSELWRIVQKAPNNTDALQLHAAIYQQCYAELTGSSLSGFGQASGHNQSEYLSVERLEATIDPPSNLQEILETATVKLPPLAIDAFEKLTVEEILMLREKSERLFEIAKMDIDQSEIQSIKEKYIGELSTYWKYIVKQLEKNHEKDFFESNAAGLFIDKNFPTFKKFYQKHGTDSLSLFFDIPSLCIDLAESTLSIRIFKKRKQDIESLNKIIPPRNWISHSLNSKKYKASQ